MAYRKRTTGRRKSTGSYSRNRPAKRKKAAPRQQVIKLVIETAPSSPVARPETATAFSVEKSKGKAKL